MALIDKKILNPIRYHQDNANTVIGQASAMKALFDQGAEDLRVKLNGVIDELLATTGAQQIGIDPARGLGNTLADALTNIKNYMNLGASSISAEVIGTGSGDNVQAQLLWLKNQIQTMVLGQIPEASITIDKLAIELANKINTIDNIGDLASLNTTQKSNLVNALNEVNSNKLNKSGGTMSGNLNVPSINNKQPCYAETPSEIVITSGFASGWSGSIKYRKNQEGLKTLFINLIRTTDITSGNIPYVLPLEIRPSSNVYFTEIGLTDNDIIVGDSQIFTIINTVGSVILHNCGSVIFNVKKFTCALSYY